MPKNLYQQFLDKELPKELQEYLDKATTDSMFTLDFDKDTLNFFIGFLLGRRYDEFAEEIKKCVTDAPEE